MAEQWLTFTKELEADVRILLCESCAADSFQEPTSDGITKVEGMKNENLGLSDNARAVFQNCSNFFNESSNMVRPKWI